MKIKHFLKMSNADYNYIKIIKNDNSIYFGSIWNYLNNKKSANDNIKSWDMYVKNWDYPVLEIEVE